MIKIEKKRFVLILVAVMILTCFVCGMGQLIYGKVANRKWVDASKYDQAVTIAKKYEKLYDIQTKINTQGYWKVSEKKQMNAIYKALVGSLGDPYSEYFTEKEAKAFNNFVNGTFYGIGIVFSEQKDGSFIINSVMEDSPADSAGLKKGDIITQVDGKSYETSKALKQAISGKEGEKVKITFLRDGAESTVECIRAEVNDRTVSSLMMKKGIAYIRIQSFSKDTASEFREALNDLTKKNPKALVIDIRVNGGGYTSQGLEIADMLLPECTLMTTKDRAGNQKTYNSDEECTKLKYALLIDENSASTSEILASAIKDNKGGILVGKTTYGKGIMQQEFPFADGSALQLTIMQYFSPNGHKIHGVGVKPDVEVSYDKDADTDTQYEKAVELLLH